jgi:hypothetical protein
MIRYTTSLEAINASQLSGFFVGWPNPPTEETLLNLLNKSYRAENCPAKAKPLTEIKLHRKIKSDAIRFTMPSAIFEDTLMALLYLGIKIHLKGDTGHIKVGAYQQRENQYLVIFDDIPGGTGHLRDFLKISLDQNASSEIVPKTFFKVLKDVKETLEKCPCENGCYSCLWGAHNAGLCP